MIGTRTMSWGLALCVGVATYAPQADACDAVLAVEDSLPVGHRLAFSTPAVESSDLGLPGGLWWFADGTLDPDAFVPAEDNVDQSPLDVVYRRAGYTAFRVPPNAAEGDSWTSADRTLTAGRAEDLIEPASGPFVTNVEVTVQTDHHVVDGCAAFSPTEQYDFVQFTADFDSDVQVAFDIWMVEGASTAVPDEDPSLHLSASHRVPLPIRLRTPGPHTLIIQPVDVYRGVLHEPLFVEMDGATEAVITSGVGCSMGQAPSVSLLALAGLVVALRRRRRSLSCSRRLCRVAFWDAL